MSEIPLSEAIASLRAELQQAMEEGKDEPLRFLISSIDVELEVTATTKVGGKVSAGLWKVVTTEATGEGSRGRTHKLKLSLTPETDTGNGLRVSDRVDERPR